VRASRSPRTAGEDWKVVAPPGFSVAVAGRRAGADDQLVWMPSRLQVTLVAAAMLTLNWPFASVTTAPTPGTFTCRPATGTFAQRRDGAVPVRGPRHHRAGGGSRGAASLPRSPRRTAGVSEPHSCCRRVMQHGAVVGVDVIAAGWALAAAVDVATGSPRSARRQCRASASPQITSRGLRPSPARRVGDCSPTCCQRGARGVELADLRRDLEVRRDRPRGGAEHRDAADPRARARRRGRRSPAGRGSTGVDQDPGLPMRAAIASRTSDAPSPSRSRRSRSSCSGDPPRLRPANPRAPRSGRPLP